MSLALKVNESKDWGIRLEIEVDGELAFSVVVIDERPDVSTDPVLLVWNDLSDEEPVAIVHLKEVA